MPAAFNPAVEVVLLNMLWTEGGKRSRAHESLASFLWTSTVMYEVQTRLVLSKLKYLLEKLLKKDMDLNLTTGMLYCILKNHE